MLCTEQQARDAGCTGDTPAVLAWIAAATVRITRYTSQLFEPTDTAVVADVAPDGLVILPRRVRTVTSVTPVWDGPDAPSLPSSAYRVTSASTVGQIDAVRILVGGYDDLVAGAESYNGGWAGLFDRYWSQQVTVAGSFGLDETPVEATQACALLAAHLQASAAPSDADAEQEPGLDVDDEGNNVRITDSDDASETAVSPESSTGLAVADALLAPYINAGGRFVLGGI